MWHVKTFELTRIRWHGEGVCYTLTLILLTWWIGWAPNNASKWQMGFNSAFKGLSSSLIIKPSRCTNFSNLFLEWNSTCFGQFLHPSSGNSHCTHSNGICHTGLLTACEQDQDGALSILILYASCQQTCMTYTIAVCTVRNSWWWTEELSETCRVSFQE